jgi:hypothetical protein
MKSKPIVVRLSKLSQQKLLERNAVLYSRELERWNRKPLRSPLP